MKKAFILICYHLGIWGILGFFATIIFGFLACCAHLSENYFYGLLIAFAVIGITSTSISVLKGYRKLG